MQGRLDFSGLPLAEAIAEAHRYSAVKLRLGDPRMAELPVGGSYRTGDNAGIAAAFSTVFPVRVARRDAPELVLVHRRLRSSGHSRAGRVATRSVVQPRGGWSGVGTPHLLRRTR